MIRRTPSAIPITDSDVQDIRDLVVEQRARDNSILTASLGPPLDLSPPSTQPDMDLIESIRIAAQRRHDHDARLGLISESGWSLVFIF
jgi:hypothetical protein